MINRSSRDPAYRQIADLLRAQILDGRLRPGDLLPFEGRIAQEYGVGRVTARAALRVLREEGLTVTERGYGTYVVEPQPRVVVRIPRGSRVWSRMPTEDERIALGIEAGVTVPVLMYQVGGQSPKGPYAADRTDFTTA
ncbi:GntR family transcriptional regulator [Micromonospora chokoriensis]|uniref:GntR family transcriptional regulator n=1 Tax=Micromonospora chokoriensis TaxID=356851 RepID=UPI0004C40DFF|nr:GntR family transcriptional regulator [Micromonospora chokoriensis]